MRFLSIYKHAETNVPPTTEMMAKMGQLIEEMTQAGTLVSTEGCLPSSKGARVRRSGGKLTVTDGPFTESKEIVGGFAVIEAKSKEEAIEWLKRAPFEGTEVEIRQVFEAEDFGAEFTPELREQEERLRHRIAENAKKK